MRGKQEENGRNGLRTEFGAAKREDCVIYGDLSFHSL
jgi:hypothetical protein